MLRDEQAAFAAAIWNGGDIPGIRPGALTAARRSAIYRHNVLTNLGNALADTTPVVHRIVGDAFFRAAATAYFREAPSRTGNLNDVGAGWADFLERYPPAQSLPYLADTARLEWAWHECFHAADDTPFDPGRLAALPAESWASIGLRGQPSVRLVRSAYPILRIWQVNQDGHEGEMRVDWQAGGDDVLIHREGTDTRIEVAMRKLPPPHAAFVATSLAGGTLLAAAEAAFAQGACDLQGMIAEFVQWGIFNDIETPA